MIMKLLQKLRNIIVGNWRRFTGQALTEEGQRRLDICMKCDRKAQIAKNEYVCRECGCLLRSKVQVLEESCYLGKW